MVQPWSINSGSISGKSWRVRPFRQAKLHHFTKDLSWTPQQPVEMVLVARAASVPSFNGRGSSSWKRSTGNHNRKCRVRVSRLLTKVQQLAHSPCSPSSPSPSSSSTSASVFCHLGWTLDAVECAGPEHQIASPRCCGVRLDPNSCQREMLERRPNRNRMADRMPE